MKEAMLYEKLSDGRVHCYLCNHGCRIGEGQRGICGVRENRGGTLYTLVYRQLISRNVDPVEKKPMFHFAPGSQSFSIATVGCNFHCDFCQNYEISQMPRDQNFISGEDVSPEQIVAWAKKAGCQTIAYTYTEPTIYFEYAFDIAREAAEAGLKNIFVTNGYMTEEALRTIHPHLHGANVDLKAFREEFYRKRCGAKLEGVLNSLRVMKDLGIWVEITTLIIPGLNDSETELTGARPVHRLAGRRRFPGTSAVSIPRTRCSTALPLRSEFSRRPERSGWTPDCGMCTRAMCPGMLGKIRTVTTAGSSWWTVSGFRLSNTRSKTRNVPAADRRSTEWTCKRQFRVRDG